MKLDRGLVTNVVLGLLALGTAAVVFVTREKPTTAELEARENNLFPAFPRDRLRSVSVVSPKAGFELTIEPGVDGGEPRYTLGAPGEAAGKRARSEADPEAALGVVRSLELAAFLRRFERGGADRKAFGLDEPRIEVRLRFENLDASLRIGKSALTPAGTTYVEAGGAGRGEPEIGLVRDDLVKELAITADDLRPRSLVPYALSELRAIRFEEGDVKVDLRRGDGPTWLDAGGSRVLRDAVERLSLELAQVRAERFIDERIAKSRIDAEPGLHATLAPAGGRAPVELRIGGACPDAPDLLVVVRSLPTPIAACVRRGARQIFGEVARTLTDDSPFALHVDEVESLILERGLEKLELRRAESGFRLVAPSQADVELEAGNRRLEALIRTRGERVKAPDPKALGLEPPALVTRLSSSVIEGTPRFEETLDIGRKQADGRLPARRRSDGIVLLLSKDVSLATAIDTSLLKSRKLLDFGPSDLVSLEIAWAGERELLRRVEGGGFELALPKGFAHDAALVVELTQALGTLSADRWVAESDDASFGFDHPRATLAIELLPKEGKRRKLSLEIGNETGGGAFGKLDSIPGVFVLPKSFVTLATTLVLSRGMFDADRSTIASITVEGKGRHVEIQHRGDAFVAREPSDLSAPAVERLIEAVTSLRAEAAVHTGAARSDEGFKKPALVVRVSSSAAQNKPKTLRIGRDDQFHDLAIYYARIDGIEATYALPQRAVRDLFEAL